MELPDTVLALHPLAAERCRGIVEEIRGALSRDNGAATEAVALVRELVTRITVTPAAPEAPMTLDVDGNLAVILERTANRRPISMVAGVGFEPTTFRL